MMLAAIVVAAILLLVRRNSIVTAFHVPRSHTNLQPTLFRSTVDHINDETYDNSIVASILEGTSPKAIKLRQQVQSVINNPSKTFPVILHGPSGEGSKSEIAEDIISRLPSWQTQQVHRISLDDSGLDYIDIILGSTSHPGIIDDIAKEQNATLLIKGFNSQHVDNKDEFDRRLELVNGLARLVSQREFISRYNNNETIQFLPRIIGCTQRKDYLQQYFGVENEKEIDAIFINVPTVQSRTRDLKDIAKAKIRKLESSLGLEDVTLSKEAIKRLLDHRWGVEGAYELDFELYKALEQLKAEKRWNILAPNMIKSRHVLVNSDDEKIRNRLLYNVPGLRSLLMSPWVFDHTLRYIVNPAFCLVVVILFFGPQSREHNAALTIFWAGWWPGIMLVFPFLGRIWCTGKSAFVLFYHKHMCVQLCPFMGIGTLAQEFVTTLDLQLKKWPRTASEIGPAFAFGLFYAILMWEELWDLPQDAALSACLLLLITAGAVVGSVIYEKRVWCRYFCPIGAMNKIFAMPAMTEIRTYKANCEGCASPTCYSGGSPTLDPSDTFAIKGCTMDLKNNQLRDVGDCVMCMSCVKNCDRESPEFNLRPIGIDFGLPWLLPKQLQKDPEHLAPSQVNTNFWLGGIITILQGSVVLHHLPKILEDVGIDPSYSIASPALDLPFAIHTALTLFILGLPGTLSYTADVLSQPLESAVNVWQRQLTRHPAENAAVVRLYESMLKKDNDINPFDLDQDGMVSNWEMKEGFKQLGINENQSKILIDVLLKGEEDNNIPIPDLLDKLQELYFDIKEVDQGNTSYQSIKAENELSTKLTFVEIFNKLDKEGTGYITKDQFMSMSDQGYFKVPLSEVESDKLFTQADYFGTGRLNLFEFMGILRKTVKVGIQEIGYGYLPLAWGSLLSYWLGLGMKELGLTLARLPDTFYLQIPTELQSKIPQFVGDIRLVHSLQCGVMLFSYVAALSLTQKLCDDNKIGAVRYGAHALVQTLGTFLTLYLLLSPEASISAYR